MYTTYFMIFKLPYDNKKSQNRWIVQPRILYNIIYYRYYKNTIDTLDTWHTYIKYVFYSKFVLQTR